MMNTLKVFVLMAVLTAAIAALGRMIGGPGGMLMAFGFAILLNFGSFWFSDKIVLKMSGAQPVDARTAPDLVRMTEALVQRANLPMPRLYIIDDPQPNAFATGRSPQNAAVAVNTGLLSLLSKSEIEGVIAHELAHVKHRDTLTMTIVATLAGAFMMLVDIARWGAIFGGGHSDDDEGMSLPALIAMSIVGPIAAMMIQSAVSRAREFEADKMAAHLTGSPDGLIGALSKLERGAQAIPNHAMSPQTAHLCIVNPFAGMGGTLLSLFSTHPPMEKRIAALAALRGQIQPVGAGNPWS
jgi:heat shock protein HtpX